MAQVNELPDAADADMAGPRAATACCGAARTSGAPRAGACAHDDHGHAAGHAHGHAPGHGHSHEHASDHGHSHDHSSNRAHSHDHDHGADCCAPAARALTPLPDTSRLADGSERTAFRIMQMDCPTEETLIRKKLGGMAAVTALDFNLMQRMLTVVHAPGAAGAVPPRSARSA